MIKFKRYSTKPWTHIIIHHSATDDGNTYDWYGIDKYHTVDLGWDEVGYHFGIEKVNEVYQYCLGRSLSKNGGHTLGMNDKAIGICVVGNYDGISPVQRQYEMLAKLCYNIMKEFDIPIYNIETHNKYATYKTCPGVMFSMETLYQEITKLEV
jgi:N-acetyl-anhydromuramyl-L-alanine amidase AmpD